MFVLLAALCVLNLLYAAIGFAANRYGQALFNLLAAIALMVTLAAQSR
jgi:hypothetical protein